MSLQEVVDRIRHGNVNVAELQKLLRHPSPLVRANAIEAWARHSQGDNAVAELVAAARDAANRVRLMGSTTVADVGIAALLKIGTDRSIVAAHDLIAERVEPERSDLVFYLQSEGLLVTADVGPRAS